MKRNVILLVGALVASSGIAMAAMGPQFGLPQNWSLRADAGYGNTAALVTQINGNPGSAMCVECHTTNPSAYILDVENAGTGYKPARASVDDRGSHFVMNYTSSSGVTATNTKGGFGGGFNNASDTADKYEKVSAWGSGASSKYQYLAGTKLASQATAGAMICESCHNIVINTATGGDNDLIVGAYQDNTNDGICLGCHNQDETLANRGGFHSVDNLVAFDNTNRKRHHVLTGDDLLNTYYKSGNDSTMWAPSASNQLTVNWCTAAYTTEASIVTLDLITGEPISFRGQCNVAGQGTRLYNVTIGDIVPTGAAAINCANCHRPHNARTQAGAFILRMGDTSKGSFTAVKGAGRYSAITDENLLGIRRQSDVGTYAVGGKIYGEYRPLCAGCHIGY